MSETDSEEWKSYLHSREYVRGNKKQSPEPFPHAGLVEDDLARRLLSQLAAHYDPDHEDDLPARVEDTRLYQQILRRGATETVGKAVRKGSSAEMSYLVGSPSMEADLSGLKAIQDIRDIVGVEAPILYIIGEPGSGKTNIALLLGQLWKMEQGEKRTEIASNIRSLEEQDRWIESYSELEKWATAHVEELPDGGTTLADGAPRKLYIFDEASSHAQGSGAQGHKTGMLLGPLVKKIRKGNAGMIIIGHDGKDVHPAVRTLAKVCERYVDNPKRASFYQSIRNRSGVDEITTVTGVPRTDWSYDDKEATRFEWDVEPGETDEDLDVARDLAEDMVEDEKRRLAAEMFLNDDIEASQTDIARALGGYSQPWVSRAVDAYENGELSQDSGGDS